ncbi:MAG: hypothetical protein H7Z76_12605 [Methylotenera sp.]|nr:hypothetical protein [Flavobacterium sp.]
MKKILFLISILTITFSSCKKDIGINKNKITQGEVQFTFNNGVTLKQCLNAVKGIGAVNYEISNFYYTKTIPNDSMIYYFNVFKSCSYIKTFDIFKKTGDPFTRFRGFSFPNLDYINYSKWDSLVQKEKLIEMPDGGDGSTRGGILHISIGQEKTWIDRLKALPEIKSADYIYEWSGPE